MDKYNHTQIGYLILYTLIAVIILFVNILIQTGFDTTFLIAYALIIFLLASFTTLTVKIDDTYLRIKFGYGIFRKKFKLSQITEVKTVKNHWYYGWGIRFWFWPRMVIYNVSGFDAVEIKMNGKTYRIGTDEPNKLEQALQ